MMHNSKFDTFSFNELINFVKGIRHTKTQSNQSRWKEGFGLESIDELEENVEIILMEISHRVQTVWNLERITSNFKNNTLNLPMELLNIYNVSPSEINSMIFTDKIGADIIDGQEEIFLVVRTIKFRMNKKGQINSF